MEKAVLDRRIDQMTSEGTQFVVQTQIGGQLEPPGAGSRNGSRVDARMPAWPSGARHVVRTRQLMQQFDAVLLACGSTVPRELDIPGRQLEGIYTAMTFLKPANLVREGLLESHPLSAQGKHVVIVGGGDTGADCLGTVHRHGARSVHQLEILPRPPDDRASEKPWPQWPLVMRSSSAHEEGGERLYSITASAFLETEPGSGRVGAMRVHQVETAAVDGRPSFQQVPGTEQELGCDLVLLAMGFLGPEPDNAIADLGLDLDSRSNVACDPGWGTSVPGVFACGDMVRGQSLIVWAIA